MFRGIYPRRVKWTWAYETNQFRLVLKPFAGRLKKGEKPRKAFGTPVFDERNTLPRYLKLRGMTTSAVVDDGHSMFLERDLRIAGRDSFDRYFLADKLPRKTRDDKGLTRRALRELGRLNRSKRPFFLWVHYFGPHGPSTRHKGAQRFGKSKMDAYDHEIVYWDMAMRPLLQRIDLLSEQRSLAVIITADHGEAISPNFRGHGGDVKEHNVHIPLIVRGPGIQPGSSNQIVSLVDVFPTIMGWTKTPGPNDIDGRDLVELARGHGDPNRIVLAEALADRGDRFDLLQRHRGHRHRPQAHLGHDQGDASFRRHRGRGEEGQTHT